MNSLQMPLRVAGVCRVHSSSELDAFIVGMYEYGTPRLGAIALLHLTKDNGLVISEQRETEAVFNLGHWSDGKIVLACVDGAFRIVDSSLKEVSYIAFPDSKGSTFCTYAVNRGGIAFLTTSSGNAAIMDVTTEKFIDTGCCHSQEIWTCGFFGNNLVGTGSDDNTFAIRDVRCPLSKRPFERKELTAGVTSFQEVDAHHFLTGGYDDVLRLWDIRDLSECTQSNVGGGVWRIERHPHDDDTIGLAAMYSGAHIFKVKDMGGIRIEREVSCPTLDSTLTYGFTWSSSGDACILGSHYDKLIDVWLPHQA